MPKDIENIIESWRCRLLLKPLQKLKMRNPIFVNGDDFTIENGRS